MHLNVPLYFLPFLFKIQQAERLVWLVSSAGRGWEWVGLPTSCSATFWQLLVFRATFFPFEQLFAFRATSLVIF